MSNIAKLEFLALDITGNNYLSWVLDAEIHLNANNLGNTILAHNKTTSQEKAKAMIFIRHHIHEALKNEYLTIKDPLVLWTKLKERYDHQKTVILPRAQYDWNHLRLQDFKSISEYNSAMFRITSKLILCGKEITDDDMLEKTFSTFHASNMVLQQQYREKGFTKYSDLISCLLVAEQNNELLMKNHEARRVGATPFPEANAVNYKDQSGSRGRGRGRGQGYRRGRGRGYNRGNYHGKNNKFHQKSHEIEKKAFNERNKKKYETPADGCDRCGMRNHWHHNCRTPKHLAELYQRSIRDKAKGIETHFTYEDNNALKSSYMDVGDFHAETTALDVDDFLIDTNLNAGGSGANANQLDACNYPYA